jgi:Fungal specific transcription factor domain/Fungal Zn(2)-Cys(6) binuclear cluster domain
VIKRLQSNSVMDKLATLQGHFPPLPIMASTNPLDNVLGHGNSYSFSINHTLPPNVPWLFAPQTHLNGFAFWYRADQSESMPRRQQLLKNRPSATPGTESVKHRRTRNGCFTCRNRRVKCDEARPICDRCRKGNRQCEFPPPVKPSKRKHRPSGSQTIPRTADASEDGDRRSKAPESVGSTNEKDTNTAEASLQTSPGQTGETDEDPLPIKPTLQNSDSWSTATKDKNASPYTDEWESISASVTPPSSLRSGTFPSSSTIDAQERNARPPRWAHLSPDLQKYLKFQQDSMTYYHYFFKLDNNDFLHNEFIDLALENESLLYAAVGFAAYHHTLEQPEGKLSHFLGYYSKAVSLLRTTLEEGHQNTPATFLTILQLATFEEYLGDWVHLSGHHRAAHHLLVELYTPQTILQTETGRQIFAWYSRFDVIAGLMAGNQTVLGRDWYVEFQAYYEDQIDPEEFDIENNMSAASAATRLIGMDMAALFSQLPQGAISIQEFTVQSEKLAQRIFHLRERIETLNDGYYTVLEFPDQKPLGLDDIVDPYKPGGLFKDAFWPLNYLWIDWYAVYQMYTLATTTILQQSSPPEMEALSLDQCRILEAIERWPASPEGSLLGCHESMAIAAVFIKKDERHTMWCRRKMASMEQKG